MDSKEQIWGANTAYLSRFNAEALSEIKKRNDKEGGRREWLANVYSLGGKYSLGEPKYGNYSGILVSPSEILTKDINVCKLSNNSKGDCEHRPDQLVATIHMHPIRTMAEEGRRQNFSGVDIASEYMKSRDEDKEVVLFLTYPSLGMTSRTNKVKAIVFPNRDVTTKAMQMSNPGVDPHSVTVENRDRGIDWIKYQAALNELGYIEEIEIENAVGAPATPNLNIVGGIIIVAVAIGGFLLWRQHVKSGELPQTEATGGM